jgi:hypothetical protein
MTNLSDSHGYFNANASLCCSTATLTPGTCLYCRLLGAADPRGSASSRRCWSPCATGCVDQDSLADSCTDCSHEASTAPAGPDSSLCDAFHFQNCSTKRCTALQARGAVPGKRHNSMHLHEQQRLSGEHLAASSVLLQREWHSAPLHLRDTAGPKPCARMRVTLQRVRCATYLP